MTDFKLDTSGYAVLPSQGGTHQTRTWGELTPFTQGYIEAVARTFHDRALWGGMRFADLAPETLARIIADCERAEARIGEGAEWGRYFWNARQGGLYGGDLTAKAPPLTVTLGGDGKVYFSEGAAS